MTKLAYFFRSSLIGLWQTPFVHLVAAITIAIALFVSSIARSSFATARALLDAWGAEVEITVYVDDAVTEDVARHLGEQIRRDAEGEVAFVSKDAALVRLRGDLGDLGSVLQGLPRNPLPATLEVRPGPRLRSAAAVRTLAARWEALAGVTAVDYGREWVDRLEAFSRALRAAGLFGALVIFGAAIVVVAATLQLAVYARREEIEIQKLVGATDAFVKAPIVLEGAFQGLAGAGIAACGLAALDAGTGQRIAEAIRFAAASIPPLAFAGPERLLEVALAGMLLGLAGSVVAAGRFLRV